MNDYKQIKTLQDLADCINEEKGVRATTHGDMLKVEGADNMSDQAIDAVFNYGDRYDLDVKSYHTFSAVIYEFAPRTAEHNTANITVKLAYTAPTRTNARLRLADLDNAILQAIRPTFEEVDGVRLLAVDVYAEGRTMHATPECPKLT